MKVLTEKEQLLEKHDELDRVIHLALDEHERMCRLYNRKLSWGFFSFIRESSISLNSKCVSLLTHIKLLREYREMIIKETRKARS